MAETTVEERDGIIILNIVSFITIQNIHILETLWNKQLDKGPNILAINFSGINRIDSIGLSHLVKLSRNSIIKEVDLIFYDIDTSILDLLKVARLDQFFNILSKNEFEEKYLHK